jgi:hypothetical protein
LRSFADEKFQNTDKNKSEEVEDLKINLTRADLESLIGA